MKKFLIILLSLTFAFCVLGAVACSSCQHDYKETIIKVATCSSEGEKVLECKLCGDIKKENYNLAIIDAEDIYDMAKDIAVEIWTYDKKGNGLSLGSGIVYSADGKIITNYHVIEESYSAEVYVGEDKYSVTSVLAYDKDIDIAILKINATNLKTLPLCSLATKTGSTVYALGSSRGLTSTFSKGIVSTSSREIDGVKYIQHDAAISNGNSGGPLLNSYCEIIGINTLTLKDSQNLNFAINISELDSLVYGDAITLEELYEKECDVFSKLKNYIISEGAYDSNKYKIIFEYISEQTLTYRTGIMYDHVTDKISLTMLIVFDNGSSYMTYVDIDNNIDGIYTWSYIDDYNQFMIGTIYGSLFDPNYILTYNSYTGISTTSLVNSVREMASAMISLMLINFDKDYAAINVTAKDLGFVHF